MPATVLILSALLFFGELNIPGLIEVPAVRAHGGTMAILYTGDGGWKATDRGLANVLANNGIPVAGLNTLHYFWTRRTPEEAAGDFERILVHYLSAWKKERVIVIGYSYGADVLPFILSRLPKGLLAHVELLALLGPSRTVDFEFHLSQWFSGKARRNSLPVLPEIQKLGELKILSFCGSQDGEALCRDMSSPNIQKILIPHAGHRFDSFYNVIAQDILKEVSPE